MEVVLDASVLTDMFIVSRKRHELAFRLEQYIKSNKINITIPIYAVLELETAIENERLNNNFKTDDILNKFCLLSPKVVYIDKNFIKEYMDLNVPYIKAGDLIYILIAKKHSAILITEDEKQYKVARFAQVSTYKINDFLSRRKA